MAITYRNPTNYDGTPKPSYEGCVLSTRVDRDCRIMSDVWADCFYAEVWTGTEVTEIGLGANHVANGVDNATVDATPETLAAVKTWRDAKAEAARIEWEAKAPEREAARLKAEAKEKARKIQVAKNYLNTPVKGSRVTITRRRGRGVPPKGTTGVVFWSGVSSMGTARVGFKDVADAVHYTSAGNCDVILPDDVPADGDVDGWVAYAARVRAEREAADAVDAEVKENRAATELAALPQKGVWVRLIADHAKFGKVFWRGVTRTGSARIGFKANKNAEAHWAGFRNGICEAEELTGDPSKRGVPLAALDAVKPRVWPTYAPEPVAAAPEPVAAAPEPVAAPEPAPEPVAHPLSHLPAPFCEIREIRDGRAYTASGVFIAAFPAAVAAQVSALLAG